MMAPLGRAETAPLPTPSPSFQPVPRWNPACPQALGGCCPNAGRRRAQARGPRRGLVCTLRPQPSPPADHRASLGHASSAPAGAAGRQPPPSHGRWHRAVLGPPGVLRSPSAGCRSSWGLLTPTVPVPAVLGHGGRWAGGGEALALHWLWLAVAGSVPALGAAC